MLNSNKLIKEYEICKNFVNKIKVINKKTEDNKINNKL